MCRLLAYEILVGGGSHQLIELSSIFHCYPDNPTLTKGIAVDQFRCIVQLGIHLQNFP